MIKGLNRQFAKAGHEITHEQWLILRILSANDALKQQDLATATDKDKVSITKLIDNLEKHEMVIRIKDKHDRRSKRVHITDLGRQVEKELTVMARDTADAALRDVSEDDLACLKGILDKIYHSLSEIIINPENH